MYKKMLVNVKISAILAIVLLVFNVFSACKSHKNTTAKSSPPVPQKQEEVLSPEEAKAAIGQSPPKRPENEKGFDLAVKGEFRNTTGVMDILSCYCNYGGYVVSGQMGEIAVCFDKLPNREKLNCGMLVAEGQIMVMHIGPRQDSPCPEGSLKVLMAKSADCY